MTITTRKMSDRHEEDLAAELGGRVTRGSGNQSRDQMDGKHSYREEHYVFAWDGKSTFGKSISISREMIAKAVEQSHWARTLIPLRFYRNERLQVDHDLVVVELEDFAALLRDANRMRRIMEVGCLEGHHDFEPVESGSVPGMFVKRGRCRGCGESPFTAVDPR